MTTITTVLGMVPLAMGWGEGAEFQRALAVTVIGGLTSSTILILFVVPIVYSLIQRDKPLQSNQ
jgi:HAE1 family hydrophobic/amphiphilic exporter-1